MSKPREAIESLADWLSPQVLMIVWLALTAVWTVLLVPSILWWSESVTWIIVMSWWANVAASAACFVAAHSDKDNEHLREEVAELKELVSNIAWQTLRERLSSTESLPPRRKPLRADMDPK